MNNEDLMYVDDFVNISNPVVTVEPVTDLIYFLKTQTSIIVVIKNGETKLHVF